MVVSTKEPLESHSYVVYDISVKCNKIVLSPRKFLILQLSEKRIIKTSF